MIVETVVQVIGAKNLINVDTDGTVSDPFALIRVGAQQQSTLVVQDNLVCCFIQKTVSISSFSAFVQSPIWDETLMFSEPASMMDIFIKDDSGKALGEVHIPLSGLAPGQRKALDLPLQGVPSGRVQLALTPGAQEIGLATRVLIEHTAEAPVYASALCARGRCRMGGREVRPKATTFFVLSAGAMTNAMVPFLVTCPMLRARRGG